MTMRAQLRPAFRCAFPRFHSLFCPSFYCLLPPQTSAELEEAQKAAAAKAAELAQTELQASRAQLRLGREVQGLEQEVRKGSKWQIG